MIEPTYVLEDAKDLFLVHDLTACVFGDGDHRWVHVIWLAPPELDVDVLISCAIVQGTRPAQGTHQADLPEIIRLKRTVDVTACPSLNLENSIYIIPFESRDNRGVV
jgi:hypothetical protein